MFEDVATNDYQPEGNFEHFNFSVEKSSSQFFISVKDIIIEIYGINSKILTFFFCFHFVSKRKIYGGSCMDAHVLLNLFNEL